MASFVRVPYVSDNGTTYQRKTLDHIATALSLTPEALGAHAPLPRSIKPRYILGYVGDRMFKLSGVAGSGGLWTGSTTTLSYPDPDDIGSNLTLTLGGRFNERRYYR